jgi:DnaJ-class molecular chaperone
MANYEIKTSKPGSVQPTGSRSINFSSWKCPYCQGTGLNPYSKTGSERCPSCHGFKTWEADTASSMLSTCGRCAGTGRINYMGNWAPCTTCKGSGKV